jgi:hypothetical protein
MEQLGALATRILEAVNPAVCRELDQRYGPIQLSAGR